MSLARRYSSHAEPSISMDCLLVELAAFLETSFAGWSRDGLCINDAGLAELDFAAAGVRSELYPHAALLRIEGYVKVDDTHYLRPCVKLVPPGVWGANSCNVFETMERLWDILKHVFLLRLPPVALITVRDIVDRVLAFFARHTARFPDVDPSAVALGTNRTFPHSNFNYCTVRVDETTLLSVHNQWNIPMSDLSVRVIPCTMTRTRRRRKDSALITSVDGVEAELERMFVL